MKLLILALLFTFTSTVNSLAQSDEDNDWESTSLTWETLRLAYLNNSNCSRDKSIFVACFRALQTSVGISHSGDILIAKELTPAFDSVLKVRKGEYGPFVVVEVVKDPFFAPTITERAAKEADYKAKEQKVLEALFASPNSPDFSQIADRVYNELVRGNHEAAGVGLATNAYLSAAFDPHTHITPKSLMQRQRSGANDEFVGIGADVTVRNSELLIIEPFRGGPAALAGIKASDIVTAIDGQPVGNITTQQDLTKTVSRLRGVAGTMVKVSIKRRDQTLELTIVRGKVSVANLESRIVKDGKLPVAYIRLRSFMDNGSCEKLGAALVDAPKRGAKGVILDLRDNGGGDLDQAVCIGGLFAGKQKITEVRSLDGVNSQSLVSGQDRVNNLPTVVLENAYSASASELVAGALQDYQVAWILGERSFGKGSVQAVDTWNLNRDFYISNTIARFYQPSGRTNQGVGIIPNFEVAIKPNATADDRYAVREADAYTNALPALSPPWQETRPQVVAKIAACVQKEGKAIKNYDHPSDDTYAPDYQLSVAEDVIACEIKSKGLLGRAFAR